MPSSSRMSVSVRAQISSSRCQSAELRARRETSSPRTMPASHADLCHQSLKAVALGCGCSREALIVVNDDHLIIGPAEALGPLPERVLSVRTFGVLDDLAHAGL